jgi:hypothetical protein
MVFTVAEPALSKGEGCLPDEQAYGDVTLPSP